ncbi:MAG: ACT domain-containing protein [Actinomycetaceae bacterium]|nr:ACT domain-containing protein [Actinomycetaceae bacterium]
MSGSPNLTLKVLPEKLTVCQVNSQEDIDTQASIFFVGRTDEELSLVCPTESVPDNTIKREDGWRAFRIEGVLDFALTGILAPIAQLMADHSIGIFAVSTFNTDYVLVKANDLERALALLDDANYEIVGP